MLNITKEFATDSSLESEGVWIDVTPEVSILVARFNNPAYRAFLERKSKTTRRKTMRSMTDDQQTDYLIDVIANTILLDWKGVINTKTKKKVNYSVEEGIKALTDSRDLLEFVSEQANNLENFRIEDMEEDKELLGKSQNGLTSGETT